MDIDTSSVDLEQEKHLLDHSSQVAVMIVEVEATSPLLAEDTFALEGFILPKTTIQELVAPCSTDMNT